MSTPSSGSGPARSPDDCNDMTAVRREIDRVDAALIALFAERWAYIRRAAALKPATGTPARVSARVAEVKANIRAAAAARGLDPELYEAIWTELIEQAIAFEEAEMGGSPRC